MNKNFFKDKRILITGGSGSLGRALVKQLKGYNATPIVYSRDEGKQALAFGNDPLVKRVIGDVRDFTKLDLTLKRHSPHFLIHAGALKRIDDLELYPDECVKTNIHGSENVARAAQAHGVQKCILISTDKACEPINVYGASKFIAERTFTNYDYNSPTTRFSSVRYGNVIASRGSFIPLWLNAISHGEPFPVTSLECTRFLFTLKNAVDTVLRSLFYTEGGEVFIPQIPSYTMESVIASVIELSGVRNAPRTVIGMRPGEKLHEDMLAESELPFTREVNTNLLAVLPQYTKHQHSFLHKYKGPSFNSSLHVSMDQGELTALLKEGLKYAE